MSRVIPELRLVGSVVCSDASPEYDDVNDRIHYLINEYLVLIDGEDDGWVRYYQDPEDASVWMLDYPEGQLQGGGPMRLQKISKASSAE